MFVPIERLFQTRSRKTELVALARRLRAAGKDAEKTVDERDEALRIRSLKLRLAAATGAVSSCGSCAAGKAYPRGAYAGGDCCSGRTEDVFDDDEVAALAQAGTRARDLVAPRGEHPGCAFRGATGCTLEVAHRPSVCVRYACDKLAAELHRAGRLDDVEALAAELAQAMGRFRAAVEARHDRAWVDAIVSAL